MCGCCKNKPEHIQTAATANGNGEVYDVLGKPATSFQVFGIIAGGTDVAFEFLTGLSTWDTLPVTDASDGTEFANGIVSAAGTYIANTTGLQKVRARVLNYGGADSINVIATAVCEAMASGGGGGAGGAVDATIVAPLGRQDEALGVSATLSTQDKAALDLIDTDLDALNAVTGTTADAAVTTNAAGTISAKLRGLVAILADAWSDALNALGVNVLAWGGTATTLGQKAMAASVPVTIASDQTAVSVDTELAAAVTLGTVANPTTAVVGAMAMFWDGSNWRRAQNIAGDGQNGNQMMAVENAMYNGADWDRWRNNSAATVLASAARTTTQTTAFTNYNWRGFVLFVNVTARAAATTLTPSITVLDPVSGNAHTIWTAAAAINVASGLFAYLFYPSMTSSAALLYTEEIDAAMPRNGQIVITPNDANSVTYSVGIQYIM